VERRIDGHSGAEPNNKSNEGSLDRTVPAHSGARSGEGRRTSPRRPVAMSAIAVSTRPMSYEFDFADVFAAWPELLHGLVNSLVLSGAAMAIGMVVALAGALGTTSGPKPVRLAINGYIELIRNTPFLVQIFLIYFGLPVLGLRLSSNVAAVLALVVNVSAYSVEIIRAGIESIQKGQIEAGKSLGLRPLQIFRLIVLKPAIQAIYPSLTSQFILLMLNSSVCSVIAATELTAVAGDIQSRTFRSFEVYFVVTCLYFLMSILFWILFATIERTYLRKPTR
jgi:polar amino acid transport system permease protein